MKISLFVLLIILSAAVLSFAQDIDTESIENGGEYFIETNDAANPCITPQQYELIEKQCAENIKLLKIDTSRQKSRLVTLLSWPVRASSSLDDCSYYGISGYVDNDAAAGVFSDYNCGTRSYDGHRGTDIFSWPFPFFKMDYDQVEVIAAAAGTIINKIDGNFDKNCAATALPANYIAIIHPDGSITIYIHMKMNSLTTKIVGETVVTGEYLGIIGSSGNSTGPHLHFEVWSGSTVSTLVDPYFGPCNTLNPASLWVSQKPYKEPEIIKASIHTANIVIPPCPETETLNEDIVFTPGFAAKAYIFIRNETIGLTADLRIVNPDLTTFSSWIHNSTVDYNASYWYWFKTLPTTPGIYTFEATYNGITCSKTFRISEEKKLGMKNYRFILLVSLS
ncbi:MAG: hypothetical protein A2161_01825, partial [Candidatus Schekmanbacteria bacterium RBG_13_48_7]